MPPCQFPMPPPGRARGVGRARAVNLSLFVIFVKRRRPWTLPRRRPAGDTGLPSGVYVEGGEGPPSTHVWSRPQVGRGGDQGSRHPPFHRGRRPGITPGRREAPTCTV